MLNFLVVLQNLVTDGVERMRNDKGATMVEYGLMVALIAVVVAVTAATLGTKIATMFTTVGTKISAV